MLDALNFVKGAVARKDFVPVQQHFLIRGGIIRAFNGLIGLSSPIPVDIDCAPKANQLIKAIESCEGTVALSLTETGRLLVRSGRFKTFVDTTEPETFPVYAPQGKRINLDSDILPALRYLEPFIADDASRQWACGIMLDGESAFATNNIVLQQYWLGFKFPCRVNIPGAAIRELLRIGESPTALQMDETRVTFFYPEQRQITTNVYETEWPQTDQLLSRDSNQSPFPDGFFDVIERLIPFCDDLGRVYFTGNRISTSPDPDNAGTTIDLPGVPVAGCFNAKQLLRLKDVALSIDFESYPLPSLFYGDVARGLIVGLRT
jgi:DNA polymerase III sliding clamp (beta) subunit (PCNA family)